MNDVFVCKSYSLYQPKQAYSIDTTHKKKKKHFIVETLP